ncbi:hypothetical protein G7Y79_00046g082190 [Physcia stellaris]|nr:hypothetical protein G7Y79_00046g082190 [Physcia stellaris]
MNTQPSTPVWATPQNGRPGAQSAMCRGFDPEDQKRADSAPPSTTDLASYWQKNDAQRNEPPPPPPPSPVSLRPPTIDEERFKRERAWLGAEHDRMEEISRRERELYGPSGAEEKDGGMEAIEPPSDPVARRAYFAKLNEKLKEGADRLRAEVDRLVDQIREQEGDGVEA